jgi:uncharacterized membrane protein YkoI
MHMLSTARKTAVSVAALAALGLGGSVIADAATKSSTTTTPQAATQQGAPPHAPTGGAPGGPPPGRHVGANGQREKALSAADAAKVKAAALAKVPGGTVERVETDVDHGSPYEAHVRKSDGTQLEVLVNQSFEVTAVNTMMHP